MRDETRDDVLNGLSQEQEEEKVQAEKKEPAEEKQVSQAERSVGQESVRADGSQETDEEQKNDGQDKSSPPAPIAVCTVRMDSAFHKSYTKKLRIVLLATMIFGLVLLVCFIVFSVLSGEGLMRADKSWMDVLLWCGAFAFGFGLVLSITLARNIRKAESSPVLTNVFSFYEGEFVLSTYRLDEKIAAARLMYSELEKITERKEMFLLRYQASAIYVVPKKDFTVEELAQLRAAFMLPRK